MLPRLITLLILSLWMNSFVLAMEIPKDQVKTNQNTEEGIPATQFFKKLPADTWRIIMSYVGTTDEIFRYVGRYVEPSNAQLEELVDEIDSKLSIACDNLKDWIAAMIELFDKDHVKLCLIKQKPCEPVISNLIKCLDYETPHIIKCLDYETPHIKTMKKMGLIYKKKDVVIAFIPFKRAPKTTAGEKIINLLRSKDTVGGKTYQKMRDLLFKKFERAQRLLGMMKEAVQALNASNAPLKIRALVQEFIKSVNCYDDQDLSPLSLILKRWSDFAADVKNPSADLSLLMSTGEKDIMLYLTSLDKTTLKKLSIILAKSHCFALTYYGLVENQFDIWLHPPEGYAVGVVAAGLLIFAIGEGGLSVIYYLTDNSKFLTTGTSVFLGMIGCFCVFLDHEIKREKAFIKAMPDNMLTMLKRGSIDFLRFVLSRRVDGTVSIAYAP